MKNLHVSEIDISYNCRIKSYPDGSNEILVASMPIFKEKGWEQEKAINEKGSNEKRENDNLSRSMRRARSQLRDIALSTKFDFFVTLTLDKEKIDRYDVEIIVKKLNVWLDNKVRRNGLTYVLVPEHHADGAIHFHGFFNDALPVVSSGHYDSAEHEIFNLPKWTYGFSTAISLYGDKNKAVGYVCKYISKQTEKIGGEMVLLWWRYQKTDGYASKCGLLLFYQYGRLSV